MSDLDHLDGWLDVGAIDDVPPLGARVVATWRGDVAVFRTASDEIFSTEDKCPHKGGPLSQGIVHGKQVTCPLHNWVIDLASGEAAAPDQGCTKTIPVRVDERRIYLYLGPKKDVETTCPYCGVGCGVVASPDGKVTGDANHPANHGHLCSKGSALAETLIDKDRLLRPKIDGQEAGWDDALNLVARRFKEAIETYGPDSVAFYVSGQFLTEDYYVANKLMKGFIGSANIDTNSRLCMASTMAGHMRAFGADVVPGVYEDWDEADLVVLVGSNTAWCHPVLYQRLAAARTKRGTRVINIDPRRTATCDIADLHLPLAAGTDVALFNGLLVHIAEQGLLDAVWVDSHTAGIGAALEAAGCSAGTVEQVAKITGLPRVDVATFYDWFASTERVVTVFSQGVNQSSVGTDKVNAITNVHLATGRIGRPGMGPFSVTGQPNAMGGREVGGLANQLAAHMGFDDPADIDRVRRFWEAPRIATKAGLKAVDLFDAVADGRIKALWVMATNPAASMPDADHVRAALESCPFVVVSDCWSTDTTARAHVVLPAAGWGEKDGTVTNSERCISRQRAFRAPPGEARSDWQIMTDVAHRLGWSKAFPYRCAADIFREHAALSAYENAGTRAFDIGALATLDSAAYDALRPIRWPVAPNSGGHGAGRMFADGKFFTADSRARFVPTVWRPPVAMGSKRYPFILNTGRVRDQWHTMTRTGHVPRLMTHTDEPVLAVHPEDAARTHLHDGDLVRVETKQGSMILKALVTDVVRLGEIFAPMHWTDAFGSSGPIDRLVSNARDLISGQPELKATAAAIEAVPTAWRALLLRRCAKTPDGDFYSARIPVERGQAFHLAGWHPLPAGNALARWITDLLDEPANAERLTAIDEKAGTYRYAGLVNGKLDSCLLISTSGNDLPAHADIGGLLGRILNREQQRNLLGDGVGQQSVGKTICVCFSVGLNTLRDAIVNDRLSSVTEIGAALRAGTNCGSCIPELKEILRDVSVPA